MAGIAAQRRAFVRRPSPRLAEGLVTHIERVGVDLAVATCQWHNYVAALRDAGWDTIEVAPADHCPDSVFIEDPIFVYRDLAVVTRPGARQRVPETDGAEAAARFLGYRIAKIESPGTLDGGDILKHGDTVWVGIGGRTNHAAVDQLAELLAEFDAKVIRVPLTKVLHLKSAVTALPDGTIIGYEPLVDDTSLWAKFLAVPEESGAHVVILDEGTVLMSASCPQTKRLLEERGLKVIAVDISEYEKLEGCVTCLSVRLRERPDHYALERGDHV